MLAEVSLLQQASLGDPEIRVAVLDGPVDLSHPCFRGAFLTRLTSDKVGAGPMSRHGTHVASVIFGQPGSPVPGIAPRCHGLILPIFQEGGEQPLSQIDLARAIERAVEEGAQIINISGGEQAPQGQANDILVRAVRLCERRHLLVVAAVGNDGCDCLHVPAALPGVLAVGAMGVGDEPLDISNWGHRYQANGVLAPGENILGAVPGGLSSFSGSSCAAPIVSGVAALLLSIQKQLGRNPDPIEIRDILLETAIPCEPRRDPSCPRYLAGVLNIQGAYALIESKGGNRAMHTSSSGAIVPHGPGGTLPRADVLTRKEAGVVVAGMESQEESPPSHHAEEVSIPATDSVTTTHPPAVKGIVPSTGCGCGADVAAVPARSPTYLLLDLSVSISALKLGGILSGSLCP